MQTDQKYKVAMIDPPWPKSMASFRKKRSSLSASLPYKTMKIEEVWALMDDKILPMMDNNSNIFIWTVEQHLQATLNRFECMKKHCTLVWDKGNGFPAAFTVRYSHEYLIWYFKGKFSGISSERRGKDSTVITESSREHSRKPDAAYKLIESWFPSDSKIDVFSRQKRDGWDQFGDQCEFFEGK